MPLHATLFVPIFILYENELPATKDHDNEGFFHNISHRFSRDVFMDVQQILFQMAFETAHDSPPISRLFSFYIYFRVWEKEHGSRGTVSFTFHDEFICTNIQ